MFKLAIFILALVSSAQAVPVHLRTNTLENPLGIDTPHPTFSWQSDAATANWMQSAYEVLVATDVKNLRPGKADVWDSGEVKSSESVNITYAGAAIRPQQRYVWEVRTWDTKGKQTIPAPAWFETGLMSAANWKAEWITRKDPAADKELSELRWIWLSNADAMHVPSATPAHFLYHLHLKAKPRAASLHVFARGQSIDHVNGQVSGHHDQWGAFDREEIASLLHPGDNEIELDVVSPHTGSASETAPSAVAASIRITDADGKEERIVTHE